MSTADAAARWDEVLSAAGEEDGRLAEALRRARPGRVAEGRWVLAVPATDVMARSTLERRETVPVFRALTERVLGAPLAPQVVLVEVAERDAPPPPAPSPEEHPQVRFVREVTGGRLLNLEEEPPATPSGRPPSP